MAPRIYWAEGVSVLEYGGVERFLGARRKARILAALVAIVQIRNAQPGPRFTARLEVHTNQGRTTITVGVPSGIRYQPGELCWAHWSKQDLDALVGEVEGRLNQELGQPLQEPLPPVKVSSPWYGESERKLGG